MEKDEIRRRLVAFQVALIEMLPVLMAMEAAVAIDQCQDRGREERDLRIVQIADRGDEVPLRLGD